MKDSNDLVNHFYDFGVTCSYDEILRFKKSAALDATIQSSLSGIFDNHTGLVQAIADNFDAYISAKNGKVSTHSIDLLLTQPQIKCDPQGETDQTKSHIKKSDMSTSIPYESRIHEYRGLNKPPMLTGSADEIILALKVMSHTVIAKQRAMHND